MRNLIFASACAAAALTLTSPVLAQTTIAEAVASPDRPAGARALDEGRKPAEVLAWSGIAAGMDVADVMPGLGYWTEMMAAIVGPAGSVAALQPEQFYNDERSTALWATVLERSPQVSRIRYPFDRLAHAPASLDLALINNSYHDVYWQSEQYNIPLSDPDVFVAALFAAMRPGGSVVVIDHVAGSGEPRATVDAMHRIDPAVVIADFERAGFVLADQSDLLANPVDDHSLSVFDEAIAGRSDRFMFRFEKPLAGD